MSHFPDTANAIMLVNLSEFWCVSGAALAAMEVKQSGAPERVPD
jgi:hypothetical protein